MSSVKKGLKGANKRCCYGLCRSDTRSKSFLDSFYYFISFPKPCLEYRKNRITSTNKQHVKNCRKCAKCDLWVKRCGRGDGRFQVIDHVKKDTYICSLHFEGESGPTEEHPDPVDCVKKEQFKKIKVVRTRTSLAEKYERINDNLDNVTLSGARRQDDEDDQVISETKETQKRLFDDFMFKLERGSEDKNTADSAKRGLVKLFYRNEEVLADSYTVNQILRAQCRENDQDFQSSNHPVENMDCADVMHMNQNYISTAESNLYDEHNYTSRSTETDENLKNLTPTVILKEVEVLPNFTRCSQGVQTDIKKFTSRKIQVRLRQSSAMDKFEKSIKNNTKKCKFYTSLDYGEIVNLHNVVNSNCEIVTDEVDQQKTNNNTYKKLTSIQQLILVLIRLRTGLLVEDLAYRFEISTALVSKTIKSWIQHLYDQFTCNLKPYMFPSRRRLAETSPSAFKSLRNIRVIVDCTEFQCESPSNFEQRGNLNSRRARNTYKALIGCTPNGSVCFVSDVFEGCMSEREIFIQSNISDHLEPGDVVLADRRFAVGDIVESKQAYLNIPPFLNCKEILSPQEEIEMKRIAKQRIYIKQVIGRIKQFRLLQKVLPLRLRPLISQILFVCAYLINFQSPIVKDKM